MTMLRTARSLVVGLGTLLGAAAADAQITPSSFGGPFCLSPAFGAASCSLTTEYRAGGLLFSQTAVFNDPPLAFGGINAGGTVDLLAPVRASVVLPGTSTAGVTTFVTVTGGNVSTPSNLILNVFDVFGALIASQAGTSGSAPTITITAPGIRSFTVEGLDTFGVREITLGTITPTATVPEPGTVALLATGLLGVVGMARRRRA